MSYQHSYSFNNLTGMKSDAIDKTQVEIQNTRFGDYLVTNHFSDNNSQGTVDFALSQPGFLIHNIRPAPFAIDDESKIFLEESQLDRPFEKLQLFQRPFATIPYMGRGGGDADIEFQLKQGELEDKHKSINPTFEMPAFDLDNYPMQDDLKDYIGKPENSIEDLALEGWKRGGVSARENGIQLSNLPRPTMRF